MDTETTTGAPAYEVSAEEIAEITEVRDAKQIDFQPVVDAWVDSVDGNKSVLLYDIEHEEIIGSHNTQEPYNTASLYKLFVVYEGYRRLQSGT